MYDGQTKQHLRVFLQTLTEQEAYFTSLNLVLVQFYSAKEAFGTLK